jgi:23S rRNA (cytosine1962-C5)-methyltransferase
LGDAWKQIPNIVLKASFLKDGALFEEDKLGNTMTTQHAIILAPGKERSVLAQHQWIFSGAVKKISPACENGRCVEILDSTGEFLAMGFLNRKSSIVGRIISFEKKPAEKALKENLLKAFAFRKKLFGELSGKMCRLVNAEADMLSGLVIDLYDTTAVIQISSLGMETYKQLLVETLTSSFPLTWIFEKSTSPSRKKEGLPLVEQTIWGEEKNRIIVKEEDLQFAISVKGGQKTGFFIDQRETRDIVRRLASGRRVLNCFSYSGAFSLAALSSGAAACCSIDASEQALKLIEENLVLNGMGGDHRHTGVCADVFTWLEKEPLDFDLIILDPPAFAKRKQDLELAIRGYREINRRALQKLPSGSFLLTCSCSYHVQPSEFIAMLKHAALQSKRRVKILSHHRHAWDHPTSIYHPETDYLKSALLYVE